MPERHPGTNSDPAQSAGDYDTYNREERYVCSHLFRLLHEPSGDYSALRSFLETDGPIESFRIYAEVALIRDAFHHRQQGPESFMDELVGVVMRQRGRLDCRSYSELPERLRTPSETHPGQIRRKGLADLSADEADVYGEIQSMFNAKPDLVVCSRGVLHVYEAKLTSGFDDKQFARTCNIAQVWAELLHQDLGYPSIPEVRVWAIGLQRFLPHRDWPYVTWEKVLDIAASVYPEGDRSRIVLERAVKLAEQEERHPRR